MNNKIELSAFTLLLFTTLSTLAAPASALLGIDLPELPNLGLFTVTLSVNSADMDGNEFEGMWVELSRNGVIIQEGPTPFSAPVEPGVEYTVFMGNWENITFDHWDDGSTDPTRIFTISEDTVFTAFFQIGSATGNTPPAEEDDSANNDPIANDDFAETDENTEVTITVLDNDFDPDNDELIIASATDGTNGFVIVNEDQTITYTPNFDFVGDDSFEYTINDGQDGFATATVFVTVNPMTS